MKNLQDEWLNQTFQLAYFIHQDRPAATCIMAAAWESLETTTLSQDKRFYYVGQRTKVSFTELHLLQRLVYEKSLSFERAREADVTRPPSAERLLVHFIKHLVWITARRNSFYVALGLGRLLHRYTTTETLELYNLILQDPDRLPAEDYCRNRKKKLMEEVQNRFGPLLKTTQEARGALRFVTHEQPARFAALVNDCLAAFTPWQTECHVPEHFVPTDTTLPAFIAEGSFSGANPDAEHTVEIKRYHALLHPDCLARLLHALGYAPSAERLDIPRFYSAHQTDADDAPDDPAGGAPLTPSERDELRDYLSDRERCRKTQKASLLRFLANGDELARLDLQQTAQAAQVSFKLSDYAEFLEIRTLEREGNLLLATHQLCYDDDRLLPQDAVIVLPNGQQLAFKINSAQNTITVADAAHWRQWFELSTWLRAPLWQPAFALALFALLAGGLAYLYFNQSSTPKREIVYTTSPTPQASPSVPTVNATPVTQATVNATPRPTATAAISDDVIVTNLRTRAGDKAASLTRGERADAVGLLATQKVFLDLGDDAFSQSLRPRLLERLSADAPFTLTASLDPDSVRLKVRVQSVAPNHLILTAKLLDASGKVIWPLIPKVEEREYKGPTDKTLNQFSDELVRDIRQLQQK